MATRSYPIRRIIISLTLAVVAVVWAWLVGLTSPIQNLEDRSVDWRFQFRGPRGQRSSEIILVLIGEDAALPYRSPIPREHLARVIEQLDQAELIGLDILLDQPSFDRAGDERLKQAMARTGNVVAVSYIEGGQEYLPDPYFREALLDYGYATFATATDIEVVRRGTLWRDLPGGRAVSLVGRLCALRRGVDPDWGHGEEEAIREQFINFSGPPGAVYRERDDLAGGFIMCPSHLVAAGIYPASVFKDKIVLIGTGLMDAPDRFRTPFFAANYRYEKAFGVEIHAHFLRTLLEDDSLTDWRAAERLLLATGLALLVVGLVLCTDAVRSALLTVFLLVLLWTAGFSLFSWQGLVVPLIVPSLAAVMALGSSTAYYALTEGREKRQVRRLFEKYLAPEVVQELIDDPSCWELGGKTMEITVMFADLEGFTPVSERLEPHDLVALINEFLTEMSRIIWMQGGTIDKYEGDLIMAFFGAPLPQTDHAIRACRAALQMQERMRTLRQRWQERDLPELRVRIGLHSGSAVVGNMGSEFRFNYTAMGDTVNLASRLEEANKEFGTYVMVSQQTRSQAGAADFNYRDLGRIMVKGKSEPTEVHELVTTATSEPSE